MNGLHLILLFVLLICVVKILFPWVKFWGD